MRHVVQTPYPPFLGGDGRFRVHQFPALRDNLVWLIECLETGTLGVVDGPDAEAALAGAAALGGALSVVLNTHTHPDHIGLNIDLAERGLLDDMTVYGPARCADAVPGITHPVDEGDTVRVGALDGRVWRTEGHIDGHVSFLFDDVLFCGDTLFAGGCGYLFDGPPRKMFDSLMRLASLDGGTRVCCAHEYTQDNLRFAWSVEPGNAALVDRIGSVWARRERGECVVPSTLEEERATNPFLRPGSPELVAAVRAAHPEASLSTPAEIFAATRALKDAKHYKDIPDDALPL